MSTPERVKVDITTRMVARHGMRAVLADVTKRAAKMLGPCALVDIEIGTLRDEFFCVTFEPIKTRGGQ